MNYVKIKNLLNKLTESTKSNRINWTLTDDREKLNTLVAGNTIELKRKKAGEEYSYEMKITNQSGIVVEKFTNEDISGKVYNNYESSRFIMKRLFKYAKDAADENTTEIDDIIDSL